MHAMLKFCSLQFPNVRWELQNAPYAKQEKQDDACNCGIFACVNVSCIALDRLLPAMTTRDFRTVRTWLATIMYKQNEFGPEHPKWPKDQIAKARDGKFKDWNEQRVDDYTAGRRPDYEAGRRQNKGLAELSNAAWAARGGSVGRSESPAAEPQLPAGEPQLPAGWQAVWSDEYERWYYHHEDTQESTWERPVGSSGEAEAGGARSPASPRGSASPGRASRPRTPSPSRTPSGRGGWSFDGSGEGGGGGRGAGGRGGGGQGFSIFGKQRDASSRRCWMAQLHGLRAADRRLLAKVP